MRVKISVDSRTRIFLHALATASGESISRIIERYIDRVDQEAVKKAKEMKKDVRMTIDLPDTAVERARRKALELGVSPYDVIRAAAVLAASEA